ncbi:elongator complex protein 4 [Punica granatum]|uniref:Elongator complex protein 4 n=2 Tax=Punica granatum TaxID=22663 RepID=A0A218Y2X0_PUNGR|nr:elongator complex protein 4 [Punica granatum]OWM91635.1 hypothetical protein CDL15_Pgr020305 [Punica granatum]PKI73250.1 hypothetical protein CRG98_006385 [Punica granatum]
MAATKTRVSSFSRNVPATLAPQIPGVKTGPNGTAFVSSGIPDLDRIVGGGFPLGSLVMVMEDPEAPHHMLLLRNFMSQGLVHNQPLLYASTANDPKGFLGTLPSPVTSRADKLSHDDEPVEEKGLRIAWQYKKYFGGSQQILNSQGAMENKHEYGNDFDVRKPLQRQFITGQKVECISLQDCPDLSALRDRCATFLAQFPRKDGSISSVGRIAIQSFCVPECSYFNREWHMLSFIKALRSMIRSSNAVTVVTFLPSVLSPSFSKRWQHMTDMLFSVLAIPDEDKDLAELLTGYQDMVGLLNIHKVARINTQVPVILEATTFSLKLRKRKYLALESLNQAPVDGSSGTSYSTSGSCSSTTSSKPGSLDF